MGLILLFLASLPGGAGCEAGPRPPRHLVFVVLDTLRADHLPLYGYERDTAPRITALARERGVVFENAFSQQTNTGPSHASMFTGLYPPRHGSRFNGQRLGPVPATLAEVLAGAGYDTAGFVSGTTLKALACGLERGFAVWDDDFSGRRRDGRATVERALAWLEARGEDPFFLFVHLYDAHGPYEPEEEHARLFARDDPGPELPRIPPYQRLAGADGKPLRGLDAYVDRYDALIRKLDDLVAGLLAAVDLDRSLVVLLSDHGETLGERYHALDHGGQLFDEQIRIPLVLWDPRLPATRLDDAVETVDLLPTLLGLLEVPLPEGVEIQGRSLVPLLRGGAWTEKERVFAMGRAVSERHADRGYRLRPRSNLVAVRDPRWKLIVYPGLEGPEVELYDLREDPEERRDLADGHPDRVESGLGDLGGWLDRGADPGAPSLPDDLLEQLRELGYLE